MLSWAIRYNSRWAITFHAGPIISYDIVVIACLGSSGRGQLSGLSVLQRYGRVWVLTGNCVGFRSSSFWEHRILLGAGRR